MANKVTAEGIKGLEIKLFCWSVCFSKGGNWAWYSIDVDGENIIQDWMRGADSSGDLQDDCVLQLKKVGSCLWIQARPLW